MPLEIERDNEGVFHIEFDPVFLINKKAIEYVSNKFAKERQIKRRIELPPRHIYLNDYENQNDLLIHLQNILNEICNFNELNPLNISNTNWVETKNDKVITIDNFFCFSIKVFISL